MLRRTTTTTYPRNPISVLNASKEFEHKALLLLRPQTIHPSLEDSRTDISLSLSLSLRLRIDVRKDV
ncbi:hypothetical protein OAV88_00990 [bacterium]|nr:hypothetical protein [bacterium]